MGEKSPKFLNSIIFLLSMISGLVRFYISEEKYYHIHCVAKEGKGKGKSDEMFSENEVQREFNLEGKNCVWGCNVTYIATNLSWVSSAAVIDLYNRMAVGFLLDRNIDVKFTMNALALRGPSVLLGSQCAVQQQE